jgi:hypothetical protein
MSVNCNLGYTPFHNKWPLSFGSCALQNYFSGGTPKIKKLKTEIFNCDPIVFPLTDCIRFAQNGSYHYTVNVVQRCDSMAKFLAPIASKNTQNCKNLGIKNPVDVDEISVSPNPSDGYFQINGIAEIVNIQIYTILGQKISFKQLSKNEFICSGNPEQNMVFVIVQTIDGYYRTRLIIQN